MKLSKAKPQRRQPRTPLIATKASLIGFFLGHTRRGPGVASVAPGVASWCQQPRGHRWRPLIVERMVIRGRVTMKWKDGLRSSGTGVVPPTPVAACPQQPRPLPMGLQPLGRRTSRGLQRGTTLTPQWWLRSLTARMVRKATGSTRRRHGVASTTRWAACSLPPACPLLTIVQQAWRTGGWGGPSRNRNGAARSRRWGAQRQQRPSWRPTTVKTSS
mmetsp:Transcript_72282/g.199332  ORF Transcript_72282/g.199332 Transcript_72282/m.199332 type:complete len:216 (-) Transcript_72282:685-1332(-)